MRSLWREIRRSARGLECDGSWAGQLLKEPTEDLLTKATMWLAAATIVLAIFAIVTAGIAIWG